MSEDIDNTEQEPKEEIKTEEPLEESEEPLEESADEQSSLPLFLRNSSEGDQGNAQDEKDSSGE